MKKTLSLILVLCLLLSLTVFVQIPVNAQKSGTHSDNVTWVLRNDGTLVISGKGKIADTLNQWDENTIPYVKNLVIEDGITSIGNNFFANLKNLVSVTMADSVEEICPYAFSGCSSLKDITFSKNLKHIGAAAFHYCTSLEEIFVPDGAEFDYMGAVMVGTVIVGCSNLKEIKVNPENPNYTTVDGVLFNKDKSTLIAYPPGKSDTSYVVPTGVKIIADGAFETCNNLKTITFNEGVTEIGAVALWMDNLETLVFPKTLEYIAPFQYLKETVKIHYAGSEDDWKKVNDDEDVVGYYCTPTYYNAVIDTDTSFASEEISVFLNGNKINFDVLPRLINDRTMVPMRAIFEAFGANVEWNGETNTVTSYKDETIIVLTIGSENMFVNNAPIALDSPACIIDGRTLVPVRAISEALDLNVDWDGETNTVNISSSIK